MNNGIDVRWIVSVETDDHRGLIRGIKAAGGSSDLCELAAYRCEPFFDDEPDGRHKMSCQVTNICDLSALIKAAESAKYVVSYCIYAVLDNGRGIRTEARIGEWTQGRPEQIGGDVTVTDEARQNIKDHAIKDAIGILQKASMV